SILLPFTAMHFANSASLVLAVAAMASAATIPTLVSFDHLVQAFPRPESTEVQPVNRQINKIKDFLLTDFYVATMADPATYWTEEPSSSTPPHSQPKPPKTWNSTVEHPNPAKQHPGPGQPLHSDTPKPIPPFEPLEPPKPFNFTRPHPFNGTRPHHFNGTWPDNFNGTWPRPFNGTWPHHSNGTWPHPFNGTRPHHFNGTWPHHFNSSRPQPSDSARPHHSNPKLPPHPPHHSSPKLPHHAKPNRPRPLNSRRSEPTTGEYTPCFPSGSPDAFAFAFSSFDNLSSFQLNLVHWWDDPADFPPPFSAVGMFANGVNVKLECSTNSEGVTACTLPADENPLHAVVNGLTN
ncbi:hypothetical protein DH86_00000587, partial [Scytalidium sp. 3C]